MSRKLSNNQAKILGIRPALEGVYVTQKCEKCLQDFEVFLTTLAGHGIGRSRCPGCAAICEITPDEFLLAIRKFLPVKSVKEIVKINKDANEIAESWYRVGALAKILSYRGINLGEPGERALFPYISLGLYLDDTRPPK